VVDDEAEPRFVEVGYELLARATTADGRGQPERIAAPDERPLELTEETYPWNEKGYRNNAYRTYGVQVTVET